MHDTLESHLLLRETEFVLFRLQFLVIEFLLHVLIFLGLFDLLVQFPYEVFLHEEQFLNQFQFLLVQAVYPHVYRLDPLVQPCSLLLILQHLPLHNVLLQVFSLYC